MILGGSTYLVPHSRELVRKCKGGGHMGGAERLQGEGEELL